MNFGTRPAIVIMAKAPRSGNAKSRLREVLSDEQAETLAAAFFTDTLCAARKSEREIIIAFTPAAGRDELQRLVDEDDSLIWIEQRGEDLGERLATAMKFAEEHSIGPVVFLGADSPNLSAEFIRSAFDALFGGADIVLGPAADGGYYLIGLKAYTRGLFDGVQWSTASVFAQTASNAERLGLNLQILPEWYDVDKPGDLERLRADLMEDPAAAEATYEWLRREVV